MCVLTFVYYCLYGIYDPLNANACILCVFFKIRSFVYLLQEMNKSVCSDRFHESLGVASRWVL
jgi:hypothetical protein